MKRNNSERMRIAQSGFLGLGITVQATGNLNLNTAGGTNAAYPNTKLRIFPDDTDRMVAFESPFTSGFTPILTKKNQHCFYLNIMKKKYILLFIVFLSSFLSFGQVNLVPNPSFEILDSCPQFLGEFTLVDWVKPTWGSSDNFSTCSAEQSGVPQNVVGWQYPKTGNSFVGTYGSDFSGNNYREYIQCQLLSPLKTGKKYEVSFWVSRADSSTFACNNIGAYFSLTAVFLAGNNNLHYSPQLVSENIITDDINWVQIIDTITAIGNEKYLTIGVFTDDDNTNRVPVIGGWMSEFYYYYDDVNVVCLDCTTGFSETSIDHNISVFPNPATDYLNVNFDNIYPEKITLSNNLGETLLVQKQVAGNTQINVSEFQGGIYFLKIETKDFLTVKQFLITK